MTGIGRARRPGSSYTMLGQRVSVDVAADPMANQILGLTKYRYAANYMPNRNLIAETGPAPTSYIFGPGIDEPLALSGAGNVSYYSVDGLGSVAIVSDGVGAVQNSYVYDAWGVDRAATEQVPQPFRYNGAGGRRCRRNAVLSRPILPVNARAVHQ